MPPSFAVTGGRPLKGTIRPAGNKNAALPILAATLLADGPCRIDNVPHIRDVETMLALLVHLGADVRWLGPNSVEVNTARAEPRELDPPGGPHAGALRPRESPASGWRCDRPAARGYPFPRPRAARGGSHHRRRLPARSEVPHRGRYFPRRNEGHGDQKRPDGGGRRPRHD